MPGTNIWSVVFWIAAIVVAVGIASPLINMWRRYVQVAAKAIEKDVPIPPWVGPTVTTVVAIGVYILVATLGWNAMNNITTSRSEYQSSAEIQEQKKVQESQLPSTEELDAARDAQKERAQTKPHQKALESFDESMGREADKIRQRNKIVPPSDKK